MIAGMATVVATSAGAAESFDEAFKNGKASGQLRLGHIRHYHDATGFVDTYATAIGGVLKYETQTLEGMQLGVATYVSQNIHALSGERSKGALNPDFFDEEVDSVAKNLTTILEPILLLIIGLVVAFVALAIVSPIYELTGSI